MYFNIFLFFFISFILTYSFLKNNKYILSKICIMGYMRNRLKLIKKLIFITILLPIIIFCLIMYKNTIILNNYKQEILSICTILLIINAILIISLVKIKRRRQQIKTNLELLSKITHLNSRIIKIIKKHLRTLLRKKDVYFIPDEYNIVDATKFEKEKEYFYNNVFLREIKYDNFYLSFKKLIENKYKFEITKNNKQKDSFLLLPKFYSLFSNKLINYKDLKKINDKYIDLNKFITLKTKLKIKTQSKICCIKYDSIENFINEYFFAIFNIIINYCSVFKQDNNLNLKTGIDLEIEVSKRLTNLGYSTTLTKTSGDQGVDVLAEKNNILIAIQCKLYSKPVGNKAVQEIIAGKSFYNANYGVVVTNNDYTKSAKELANKCGIFLFNIQYLESSFEEFFNL